MSCVGVYQKTPNTYVAHIKVENKRYSKTFHTFEEAVKQRKEWEEKSKQYYKEKEERKLAMQKALHLCTNYCEDCIYSNILYFADDSVLSCLYLTKTGKSRPCYAGDNCTVKISKK